MISKTWLNRLDMVQPLLFSEVIEKRLCVLATSHYS